MAFYISDENGNLIKYAGLGNGGSIDPSLLDNLVKIDDVQNKQLYARNNQGEVAGISYDVNPTENSFPTRGVGAVLKVGAPQSDEDATTKVYVDTALNGKLGNSGEQILNGTLQLKSSEATSPVIALDESITIGDKLHNTSTTTTNVSQITTDGLIIGEIEETTTPSGSDTVAKEVLYGLSDIKVNGSSIIRFTDGDVTVNGNLTSLSTEATPVNYIAVSKQYTIEGTSATQDINANSKISPSIIDLSVEGTLTNASGTTITANAVRIDPSSMRISGKPFSFSIKSSADDSYSRAALISTNGVFNFYETPTVSMDDGTSEGLMSESQVIRTDAAQTLTASEKQQAQTNMTHTATQNYVGSGSQVGWYQVANLKTNGNYDIKIKQAFNYLFPEAIQLAISINHRFFTNEPFASITQISGVKPGTFSLSKIRVRQGTDEGTTFLDVYNPDQLWNTTWVDITSDTRDVVVETNTPFEFIGTEDNPSGYKISSLDLVTGFNTSYLRANTATILGTVSNLNTISQPVNSTVTYSFIGGCANAPITDSGMVTQMQESTAFCTQLVIANDADASTWRRSYRDGTWTEWTKVGTFLPYEYNKAISFGESGYLYIGKFPIYDTNITVDISCTTSTTYSGKLVIACQNYVVLKASVFGDYSNTVTPNIYYKVVDNTVEIYFTPQAWSKNVIHITGCSIRGEVTHVCEKISAIPSDATSHPENEFGEAGSNSNGYYFKYGDGLLLCWGTKSISSNNQSDIVLPYPFKDTNYVGNANGTRANYGNEAFIPISTSTYKILGETNSNPFRWQAIGYWK